MTRYLLSDGNQVRDALVASDANLSGVFFAIDLDTGDTLRVRGWQLVDVLEVQL